MRNNSLTIETAPAAFAFPKNLPGRCVRKGAPLISSPRRAADCRVYLQRLRAAEMDAWEQTGGDYLVSNHVARLAG